MAKNGFVNGSDMLLYVNDNAIGHCTTHTTTCNSETKERACKPAASKPISSGRWKSKSVTSQNISITFSGFCFYGEAESGYKTLFKAWKAGEDVMVKCMERENDDKPYLAGAFLITQLEREDPAQDDATYKGTLENDGEPDTLDESAITEGSTESASTGA